MTDTSQTSAVEAPQPKRPAETFIMVEGAAVPANLQPPQSELQDAFRMAPGKTQRIVIDMAAALPIAQDMVRQARATAFVKNDAATMQALQNGDDKARLAAKEKGDLLRAAPKDKRLTAAKTPDDLLDAVAAVIGEF